jgi:hypothetical protein
MPPACIRGFRVSRETWTSHAAEQTARESQRRSAVRERDSQQGAGPSTSVLLRSPAAASPGRSDIRRSPRRCIFAALPGHRHPRRRAAATERSAAARMNRSCLLYTGVADDGSATIHGDAVAASAFACRHSFRVPRGEWKSDVLRLSYSCRRGSKKVRRRVELPIGCLQRCLIFSPKDSPNFRREFPAEWLAELLPPLACDPPPELPPLAVPCCAREKGAKQRRAAKIADAKAA